MTWRDLQELTGSLGPGATFLLLIALITGSRGLWVFGWVYRAKAREAEEYRRLALRGTDIARSAISEAKDVLEVTK